MLSCFVRCISCRELLGEVHATSVSRLHDAETMSAFTSSAGNSNAVPRPQLKTSALSKKDDSGKCEAHLTPSNCVLSPSSVGRNEGRTKILVELLEGVQTYRYQNDQVTTRTHAFDDCLTRVTERLTERFGFPTVNSMHAHGDDLFTVARVCFKSKAESIDEFGVYLQSTIISGQPRMR